MGLDCYVFKIDQSKPAALKAAGLMKDIKYNMLLSEDDLEKVFQWRKHWDLHKFFESEYDNHYPKKEYNNPDDPWETSYFNSGQYVRIDQDLLQRLESDIGYEWDEEEDKYVRLHTDVDLDFGPVKTFDYDDSWLTPDRDMEFVETAQRLLYEGHTLFYTSWW